MAERFEDKIVTETYDKIIAILNNKHYEENDKKSNVKIAIAKAINICQLQVHELYRE